ncbi:hypothetical protein SCLCIDRAFT_1216865 [Scleroderma citrinum Foug A]|uniref:Uncharacterized protein n=1 Tax=Scleroderma citrinum Foug A TaxID=1036808 RepID=A0A0C3A6L6_9AGAM|nr:hypothetical protein SCLCIDRAFT_1216865 [Scleroderma citrinum Foug A]
MTIKGIHTPGLTDLAFYSTRREKLRTGREVSKTPSSQARKARDQLHPDPLGETVPYLVRTYKLEVLIHLTGRSPCA